MPKISNSSGTHLVIKLRMVRRMPKIEHTGVCHCGAIRFSFQSAPIKDAMRCDCSICSRKGIMLSSFVVEFADLQVTGTKNLKSYRFGTNIARHLFCETCGIHPFVETRLNPGCFRINLGCVDGIAVRELPVFYYDGRALE